MTRKEALELILASLEDHYCGCDMWNDYDDAALKACRALIDEQPAMYINDSGLIAYQAQDGFEPLYTNEVTE